jgi:transposase
VGHPTTTQDSLPAAGQRCRAGFFPPLGSTARFQLIASSSPRLRLAHWKKIETFLAAERFGRPPKNDRLFVEAVLWWRRTGVPWRDLSPAFGPWKTVFNRFDRWSKSGKWLRLFEALRTDRDDEWHSLDSTINRAHQHAAGGKGGPSATPSGGRGAARRARSTSSSMRSGSRSPSR